MASTDRRSQHCYGAEAGLPISFDVSFDAAKPDALQISNLSFQTNAECWGDGSEDGTDDSIVARIAGPSGEVDSDGDFYIDESPDEDNEYEVEGTLRDGRAKMDVIVGGYWGAPTAARSSAVRSSAIAGARPTRPASSPGAACALGSAEGPEQQPRRTGR